MSHTCHSELGGKNRRQCPSPSSGVALRCVDTTDDGIRVCSWSCNSKSPVVLDGKCQFTPSTVSFLSIYDTLLCLILPPSVQVCIPLHRNHLCCALPYAKLDGYSNPSSRCINVSLILLALTNLEKMLRLPALSFVPLARAPPNGCWPTTAPVHLSL